MIDLGLIYLKLKLGDGGGGVVEVDFLLLFFIYYYILNGLYCYLNLYRKNFMVSIMYIVFCFFY